MTDDFRFTIRITRELNEKLSIWSKRLGVNKSQLANMSIQAGLGQIIRAISPEDALTPEQWAAIIKRVQSISESEDKNVV